VAFKDFDHRLVVERKAFELRFLTWGGGFDHCKIQKANARGMLHLRFDWCINLMNVLKIV
jgi:hypothetical protein